MTRALSARLPAVGIVAAVLAGCVSATANTEKERASRSPNIVIFFVDDMGYSDIGSFGSPSIRTPSLDQLAAAGQKWTNFYSASPVCTPSRSGLLTGRLPIRSGTEASQNGPAVFFPFSKGGLPGSEITIAEMLRARGYATAAIGKWHLGHLPEYLPNRQGFDQFFGIPYSNDMDATDLFLGYGTEIDEERPDPAKYNVPLLRNGEEVERPIDQFTMTSRFTEEAVSFIENYADQPFFLYLAHPLPHVPLFVSESFRGRSAGGYYGDVIEELDWSVGRVNEALERTGIEKNTLFIFTSDNGPWLIMRQHGGTAGPLREGKGTTWDGGMRVPTIFSWPGRINPGVVTASGTSLDLLPTIAALTGAKAPSDRRLDGVDISATLQTGDTSATNARPIFFYRKGEIYAIRQGSYKAHFITESAYLPDTERKTHDIPLLFDVQLDPGENFNVADKYPGVVAHLIRLREEQASSIKPVENQLDRYDQADRDAYFSAYSW